MVVLVAETTGVGYGLGQVIMLARNTFNPWLVFFTIFLIGLLGFVFDWLRLLQRQMLYWVPTTTEDLGGGWSASPSRGRSGSCCIGVGKTWEPAPAGRPWHSPTSTSRWRPASSSCFSGPQAAARAPCST